MVDFKITNEGAKAFQAGGKEADSILYLRKVKTKSGAYEYKIHSTDSPLLTRIKHIFTGINTHYSYGEKAAKNIQILMDSDPTLKDLIQQKLGKVPESKKEPIIEKEIRTMRDYAKYQADTAQLARRIKILEDATRAEKEKLDRRVKIVEKAERAEKEKLARRIALAEGVKQPATSTEKEKQDRRVKIAEEVERAEKEKLARRIALLEAAKLPAEVKVEKTEIDQLTEKIKMLENEISVEKDNLVRRNKKVELADLEFKAKAQKLIRDYSHLHVRYKNNPDLTDPLTNSKDINRAVKECVLSEEEQKLAKDLINIGEYDQLDDFWFTNTQLSEYVRFCKLPEKYPDVNFDFILDRRFTKFAELNPRNCLDQLNVNDKRNTPIRVHISGNHWGFIFIDHKKRSIEFYDSFSHFDTYERQGLQESLNKAAIRLGSPPYKIDPKYKKAVQTNGYQCGPWSEFAMFHRLANPEADFNQLLPDNRSPMIAHFRNHMIRAALKEQLDVAEMIVTRG